MSYTKYMYRSLSYRKWLIVYPKQIFHKPFKEWITKELDKLNKEIEILQEMLVL